MGAEPAILANMVSSSATRRRNSSSSLRTSSSMLTTLGWSRAKSHALGGMRVPYARIADVRSEVRGGFGQRNNRVQRRSHLPGHRVGVKWCIGVDADEVPDSQGAAKTVAHASNTLFDLLW